MFKFINLNTTFVIIICLETYTENIRIKCIPKSLMCKINLHIVLKLQFI